MNFGTEIMLLRYFSASTGSELQCLSNCMPVLAYMPCAPATWLVVKQMKGMTVWRMRLSQRRRHSSLLWAHARQLTSVAERNRFWNCCQASLWGHVSTLNPTGLPVALCALTAHGTGTATPAPTRSKWESINISSLRPGARFTQKIFF